MNIRNIIISFSSFVKRRKFFFITFLVFASSATSCKKESDVLGLELQPESEILNAFVTDTSTLITYPLREDSIRTDSRVMLVNNLVGSYTDPVFGRTTASYYSQFRLTSSNVNFGNNPQLDSIVLSLAYAGYYGDTTTTQTISVYKMTESINADSNYYSTNEFAVDNTPVGTLTFQPKPNTPVFIGSDTVASSAQIRITLNANFGNDILNAGSGNLSSNDSWLQFLPGLFIKADDVFSNGAILYINYASSQTKLTVYYRNNAEDNAEGPLEYSFVISASAARVNKYQHDYNVSQITFEDSLNNVSYVQSTGGVKTKINLPYLNRLIDQGPVAVNKAELIIKVADNTTDLFAPNDKFVLFASDSIGKNVVLPDQIASVTSSFFGGEYNAATKEYVFNIPRYVQQIINGTRDNYGLFLLASSPATNANRTIIGSGNFLSPQQMKLKITFTRIQ